MKTKRYVFVVKWHRELKKCAPQVFEWQVVEGASTVL